MAKKRPSAQQAPEPAFEPAFDVQQVQQALDPTLALALDEQAADRALDDMRSAVQQLVARSYRMTLQAVNQNAAYQAKLDELRTKVADNEATTAEQQRLARHEAVMPAEALTAITSLLTLATQYTTGIHDLDGVAQGRYFEIWQPET